jgi:hypothetical protein
VIAHDEAVHETAETAVETGGIETQVGRVSLSVETNDAFVVRRRIHVNQSAPVAPVVIVMFESGEDAVETGEKMPEFVRPAKRTGGFSAAEAGRV